MNTISHCAAQVIHIYITLICYIVYIMRLYINVYLDEKQQFELCASWDHSLGHQSTTSCELFVSQAGVVCWKSFFCYMPISSLCLPFAIAKSQQYNENKKLKSILPYHWNKYTRHTFTDCKMNLNNVVTFMPIKIITFLSDINISSNKCGFSAVLLYST